MRVLVACEFSGTVRDAFAARGHYARSVDLLPSEALHPIVFASDCIPCPCCEDEPYCVTHEMHYAECPCLGPSEDEVEIDEASYETPAPRGARHLSGDLFSMDRAELESYDLVIAHPPCTYLANSGAKHLYRGMKKENGPNPARWAAMREGAAFFKRCLELPAARIAVENPIMLGHARELIGAAPAQVIQPWQFGHGETKATCLWLKNLPPLKPTKVVSGRVARVHKLPPSSNRWKLRSMTYQGIADAMAEQWGNAA